MIKFFDKLDLPCSLFSNPADYSKNIYFLFSLLSYLAFTYILQSNKYCADEHSNACRECIWVMHSNIWRLDQGDVVGQW